MYKDQIVLLNTKTNLYLHISEKWLENEEKILPMEEDWRPFDADRRNNPAEFAQRYEVNCSTSASTYKLLLQTSIAEYAPRKFVKGSDVVRLRHTELGGYLTSDDLDFTDDQLAEVYVKRHKGDSGDDEATTSGDLFEIEIASNSDRGQVCVFSGVDSSGNQGCFRLRHLNSGRLVVTQQATIGGKQIATLGLGDHVDDSNSKVVLE